MNAGARWILAALIAFAPLPFGAVLGWTTSLLATCLGILLIVVAGHALATSRPLPHACGWIGLAAVVAALPGALQLLPLPRPLLKLLSPETARFYGTYTLRGASWRPLSEAPDATAASLLWLGACAAAACLVAMLCDRRDVRKILLVLVALGATEAFYGILEFLSGRNRIFLYEKQFYLDSATGTYINRNHFAGLMVLLLPVGLGWLLARRAPAPSGAGGLRERLLALAGARTHKTLLLGLAVALMGAGLALSFSRAGVVLGLLVMAGTVTLCRLAPGRPRFGRRWPGLSWAAALALLALLPLTIRGPGRLGTMMEDVPQELAAGAGRTAVWASTLRIIADHPLLGTGLGTFGVVFPRYRPLEIQSTYTHAHQDYLQWLAETGAAGALAGLLLLGGLLMTARRALRSPGEATDRALAAGICAALAGFALHGLVDFNGHIPANLLVAWVLAGSLVVLARTEPAGAAG